MGVFWWGVLSCALCFLWRSRRGRVDNPMNNLDQLAMVDELGKGSGPMKFRYRELARSTYTFAEEGKLGEGGFGGVYNGFLKGLNCYIAVKRISSRYNQGIKDYASEVKIITRLRHRNLVQLIGWCHV